VEPAFDLLENAPDGRYPVRDRAILAHRVRIRTDGPFRVRGEEMAGWNGWAWLGGPVIGGRPVAGRNVDGRLEVFGHASGGAGLEIVHAWQDAPGAGWSAWGPLGAPPTGNVGDLALGENGDGRLELFVREGLMSSGVAWHAWQEVPPATGWSAWSTLGSPPGGLANVTAEIGRNGDGRLEAFGFASDGALWHIWQQAVGGWSGWHSLGTPSGLFPFGIAVAETPDGRLAVFVVVLGGRVWRRQQEVAPGTGWDTWEDLGMPAGTPLTGVTAARNADGRLEVFSVSSDLNVWHRAETTPGGAWSGWANLDTPAPAFLLDRPAVGTNADGRLELFTVSRDGAGSEAWHIWQDGATPTGWSAWESLGGNPGGLNVAQNADGRLEVFATLGDGTPGGPTGVLHRWQTTPNGGWSIDQSWVPTLVGSARRLAQTTRGTTFAWGAVGLFRSEDAGLTWTALPTPPAPSVIAIDPSDAHTLFAASGAQVHKTTDDGATWTPVLPTGGLQVLAIAVSPADPDLVFVALAQFSASFQVHRSLDGGATWTRIEGPTHGATCIFSVPILVPHPSNPSRVLRASGCYAGRDVPSGDSLDQSLDQGVTWSLLFHPRPLFPSRLIGGMGSQPDRWYLAAHFGASPGGGRLFRSDDDGATWTDVLAFASGPAIIGAAYEPWSPDRVFAALSTDLVKRSDDGGVTWTDLPFGPSQVADLLLTPGGQALLAATNQGVWRIDM
jgi:hypothetical protein